MVGFLSQHVTFHISALPVGHLFLFQLFSNDQLRFLTNTVKDQKLSLGDIHATFICN